MPNLSKIEQAVVALETAQVEGQIPEHLRERIVALGGVRSNVKGALAAKSAEEERRELSFEQADRLVLTLKSRFELSKDENLRKVVDFAEVEKSLHADPEALFSLQKLEETGGEPQMVGVDGDVFVFEDRSKESPLGRRGGGYFQADDQRKSFGPNVRFQSPNSYKIMQKTGNFDLNSLSWLEGGLLYGRTNSNLVERVSGFGASNLENIGWRASLRVKKA